MNKLSGGRLFIIQICVLAAFLIFGVIACSYLFVNATAKAEESDALDAAVVRSESIAETLKATDGDLQKTGNRNGERNAYEVSGDVLYIYLDDQMNPCSKSNSSYYAKVNKTKDSMCRIYTIDIAKVNDDSIVYNLEFSSIAGGGALR